jgi:sec-independent protein translocase protein TatB
MFDIGFAELLLVAVMGLVVLGPEKLPTAARTIGLWVGRIRNSLGSIQREISAELKVDELKRTAAVSKKQLDEELKEMSQPYAKPFGKDSPAEKSAMESPTPEFDPASFTSDKGVVDAYAKKEEVVAPTTDAPQTVDTSLARKAETESSDSKRDL